MIVSVEVPVIRGGWLLQCIDSVVGQTSANWVLSLLWDGGDDLSRRILEELAAAGHPRIQIFFGDRMGIGPARRYLTEHSRGELIVPLDDDDVLEPSAVACFIAAAVERPWAGIVRARRGFIDESGAPVQMQDWFPFERRHYAFGATLDVSNHAQPYAIRRADFLKTEGWIGFNEVESAGEDCSCFTAIEELGEIELLDKVLYQYRLHDLRTSHRITLETANELWRRIADSAACRRRVSVRRVNERPPFIYERVAQPAPMVEDVDFVIPFWEANERELSYCTPRPQATSLSETVVLEAGSDYRQQCSLPVAALSRLAIACSSTGPVRGNLTVSLYRKARDFSPAIVLNQPIEYSQALDFDFVSCQVPGSGSDAEHVEFMEISFTPIMGTVGKMVLHTIRGVDDSSTALMRPFTAAPLYSRGVLNRCLASLSAAGVAEDAIHVIEERRSSSANRNFGFKLCSKPWICFMDDDAELAAPDTLKTMIRVMTAFGASLGGPKLVTPSNRIYSGQPYANALTLETCVTGMAELDTGQFSANAIVPWLPSTVLLIHSSVMHSTGGFDESFQGSQHEDADFSMRARSRGFQCCYIGETKAIHHNQLRNGNHSANKDYFKRRWASRPDLFEAIEEQKPVRKGRA